MDRETNFRDNGNAKAQTVWENDFSNKNEKWDIKTLCNKENNFSTKDQKIGADSNKGVLSNKTIWATNL